MNSESTMLTGSRSTKHTPMLALRVSTLRPSPLCSIKFEDGKILPMTVDSLAKLFTAMPVLEMLLVGREGMHELDDCTLHLKGAYGVDSDQFAELLQAISSTDEDLLKMIEKGEHTVLLHRATKLGGCDELEQRIRQIQQAYLRAARRQEAVTPAKDRWNLFEWVSYGPIDTRVFHPSTDRAKLLGIQTDGYELASTEEAGGDVQFYHLRRLRSRLDDGKKLLK